MHSKKIWWRLTNQIQRNQSWRRKMGKVNVPHHRPNAISKAIQSWLYRALPSMSGVVSQATLPRTAQTVQDQGEASFATVAKHRATGQGIVAPEEVSYRSSSFVASILSSEGQQQSLNCFQCGEAGHRRSRWPRIVIYLISNSSMSF